MWGYQRHFQISLKVRAEDLFEALDPGFEVGVFLLGLVRNESPANHPVCLEPEECGFELYHFASVRNDAKHYLAVDPDRNMMATHPAHQRSIERRRERRAECSAVMKAIEDRHHHTNDEFYFSGFMPVADYDVGVVLRLHHCYGVSHYQLPSLLNRTKLCRTIILNSARLFFNLFPDRTLCQSFTFAPLAPPRWPRNYGCGLRRLPSAVPVLSPA